MDKKLKPEVIFKSYPRRWLLLISVLTLNIANYSHWIAFAAVHSKVAEFYQVSNRDVQLILTVSYSLAIPCSFLSTFIIAKFGLRTGLLSGASLTLIGGFLCCVSTLPGVREADRSKCLVLDYSHWSSLDWSGQSFHRLRAYQSQPTLVQ